MKVHIDIETYSEADLKKNGLYRYAADYSTELLVACYAIDDGEVQTWWPFSEVPAALASARSAHVGVQAPADLLAAIARGATVYAHNAAFERTILSGHVGRRHGLPVIPPGQMVCTAAKAAAHGLPRSLEDACNAIGVRPKMAGGRANMLQLAKPRTGKAGRYSMAEFPQKYAELAAYCVDDVKAERELDARLPDLTPREQAVWELDQVINDRGVRIDRKAIADVLFLIAEYKKELAALCLTWTGFKPTQTAEIANWVRGHGYPQLLDLQKDTVHAAVNDPACPRECRRVLQLRSTYAMAAVAKYAAMEAAAGDDDRLRGMLLYHGAATGRWSSLIVQLQNLFRPVIDDVPAAIDAFAARSLQWIKDLYAPENPMRVFASSIRGMLVPAPGKQLMALDFAGIESRVTAWVAGEEWKLQAFRENDADETKPDTYKLAYAKGFGLRPETVTKAQRQVGKVMELSMGFEGGVGAFVKMAKTYGLNLTELADAAYPALPERALESAQWMWDNYEVPKGRPSGLDPKVYLVCDGLKQVWRQAHPRIVDCWADLLSAAKAAVLTPGLPVALPNKRVVFKVVDRWLILRLPSGRRLHYLDPRLDGEDTDELRRRQLTYMGTDTATRRWMRAGLYGGRLMENVAQATSRDKLVDGMFALEAAGLPIVLTVHDEVVMEVDAGDLASAAELMCRSTGWDKGLPVKAEGWVGMRYRK